MPIIGVVGAGGVQSLIPDRAKIEQKLQDEYDRYLASKPKFPPRAADGSIDREAALRELQRFGVEEFRRLPYVSDGSLENATSDSNFGSLLSALLAQLADAGGPPVKPVVAVFLDP